MEDEKLDVFGKHLCRAGRAAQKIRTLEEEKQEINQMRENWLEELKKELAEREAKKKG